MKPEDTPLDFKGKLEFCAYLRNVLCLPNRTIVEFAEFVNSCIWGDLKNSNEFYNKEHGKDNGTFEGWINAFFRYCVKEYNGTWQDYDKFRTIYD